MQMLVVTGLFMHLYRPHQPRVEGIAQGFDPVSQGQVLLVVGVLQAIVERIPPPRGDAAAPTRAMIFDSHYDQYRGAVAYARVVDGTIKLGDTIQMMSTGRQFEVTELGVLQPGFRPVQALGPGEVGCIMASMKDVRCLLYTSGRGDWPWLSP